MTYTWLQKKEEVGGVLVLDGRGSGEFACVRVKGVFGCFWWLRFYAH